MDLEDIHGAEPIVPSSPKGRSRSPIAWKATASLLLGVLLLLGLAIFWLQSRLAGSLPATTGQVVVAGLGTEVLVYRDKLGVPTIDAHSRIDAARALGFLHAQDRFFQMDLLRRQAAGELAALMGPSLLQADRYYRIHRFRHRSRRILAGLEDDARSLAIAYAEGVNAGLAALDTKPWEYFILNSEPRPWEPEDIVLVAFAMYLELNDERGAMESARGLVHDVLGDEVERFLFPIGTEWDAPLDGSVTPAGEIPPPEAIDLRTAAIATRYPTGGDHGPATPRLSGSNNMAVAGSRTDHGGAILANDMHLSHSVPNIWYRARLRFPSPHPEETMLEVSGVTLPGIPFVIAGSNRMIAWGHTNTHGDWEDLVIVEPVADNPDLYSTPDGPQPFEHWTETIRVKGQSAPNTLEGLETRWGPIVDHDHRERPRALRWIAHDPQAVNFGFLAIEGSRTVEEAVEAANRVGAPPQNFLVADSTGRVAWSIMGPIPRRVGHEGRLPSSWTDGTRRWDGWLAAEEYPRIIDPPSGLLWTANSRVVGGEMLSTLGPSGFWLGARGKQIRDSLYRLDAATEKDLLAIQLDDRALFLQRWQLLLLESMEALDTTSSDFQTMQRLVRDWDGRAGVDSVGYRLVRIFRDRTAELALGAITEPCREVDEDFSFRQLPQYEAPLWTLLARRPAHLLDARFASWEDLLNAAVVATLESIRRDGTQLDQASWGRANRAEIRHALSGALPALAPWIDMPPDPLPGDENMPRFQSPRAGASERMVVSPGREALGILHMPGGQSGHPLSPHYGDGHQAWLRGDPTPFLPGVPEATLRLIPPGRS